MNAVIVAASSSGPNKVARRPQDQITRIRGNFCNLYCAWNATPRRLIFDPYIASISAKERAVWFETHRQNGSTHIVLSPSCAYSGAEERGYPAFDWLADPQRFATLVREVLSTPSADGFAFTPIIILDSGTGSLDDIRGRMTTFWRGIREALGDDERDCLVVPGWELIKASASSSKLYSDMLQYLKALEWSHRWAHLSVERAACSSNPVEADDPWQGGESACWKSHGGEDVEGLLYQASAFTGDTRWLERWDDVVPRLRQGMNGWRPMHLCLFETVAYGYWNGWVAHPETEAREQATYGRDWARDVHGVTDISFGNGLPL